MLLAHLESRMDQINVKRSDQALNSSAQAADMDVNICTRPTKITLFSETYKSDKHLDILASADAPQTTTKITALHQLYLTKTITTLSQHNELSGGTNGRL
jgi:hypothetical protein